MRRLHLQCQINCRHTVQIDEGLKWIALFVVSAVIALVYVLSLASLDADQCRSLPKR